MDRNDDGDCSRDGVPGLGTEESIGPQLASQYAYRVRLLGGKWTKACIGSVLPEE